jgi:hypothetical protein
MTFTAGEKGMILPPTRSCVDARRLRDKLREYYSVADAEQVIISLPKGSYIPSFERGQVAIPIVLPGPEPVSFPSPPRYRRLTAAAVAMLLTAGAAAWFALRPNPAPGIRIRPLTSLTGPKTAPSLSPDGNFVVFGWGSGRHEQLRQSNGRSGT